MMMMDQQPDILVRILHSIPHVNSSFRQVNDIFDPDSDIYLESLAILALIPAGLLIISLFGLLIYLLTRCCDRKPRKPSSQTCQNCSLVITTLLCCAAIALGLYGNDDFHNGLLQAFDAGKQVESLVDNLRNQTESIKDDLDKKSKAINFEELIDKPNYNQTAVTILLQTCPLIRANTTKAITHIELVVYFMKNTKAEANALLGPNFSLQNILEKSEKYESLRWPITLGYLTILLLLCAVLIIGVARRSRCALIFFSVFGLFGVIICWFLAGVYLASSVALGDFCMKPHNNLCKQVELKSPDDIYYLNCGTLRNRFMLRLNQSKDHVDYAQESLKLLSRMSHDVKIDINNACENMYKELDETKSKLTVLSATLDRRSIDKQYADALKGLCGSGLVGLSLMMIAGIFTALLLTILVYADSHAWIYLTKRQPDGDKSETAPLFPASPTVTVSPTAPITSGTINRTLLHHQNNHHSSTLGQRNGSARLAGLANLPLSSEPGVSGDSPPPGYDVVVHGARNSGHSTLGRLPSHHQYLTGPNNGKYATLSKQCKTLEANDFY